MAKLKENVHLKYNIVLMGDPYCGKTSIIERYTTGRYGPCYIQTLATEFAKKEVCVDGTHLKMYIFDTAGQKDMETIIRSIYRNAQGILIVFDVSRRKTLEHIHFWMDLVQLNCDTLPEILLLGNKVDLEQREVTTQDAETIAESYGIRFLEVSAKKNLNIDLAFNQLATQMFSNRKRLYPESLVTSIKLHQDEKGNTKCCISV